MKNKFTILVCGSSLGSPWITNYSGKLKKDPKNLRTRCCAHIQKGDLSILIDSEIKFENIYKVSKQINQKLIKEITLFDVYEGKNLPKNKKSYGISFKMQDNEKTLSEAEIESVMSNITSKLKKEFNAELR